MKLKNLNSEYINELLYSYEQGFEMGKDATKVELISIFLDENVSISLISKIFNIDIDILKRLRK